MHLLRLAVGHDSLLITRLHFDALNREDVRRADSRARHTKAAVLDVIDQSGTGARVHRELFARILDSYRRREKMFEGDPHAG